MGVLGDDDIEKLNQSFKKRKIPKRFYDPVKGYEAYDIAVTIAAGAIFLVVFFFIFGNYLADDLKDTNKMLIKQRDDLIIRSTDQINLIIDNADCSSLFAIYQDSKNNENLNYFRDQIKDELAFRCK